MLRQTGDLAPELARFVILVEHGHAQVLRRQPQLAGDELPREANGVALEVVAEGEVAEHLEEGVMPGGVPHLLEVVVLAAGAHALLAFMVTSITRPADRPQPKLVLSALSLPPHRSHPAPHRRCSAPPREWPGPREASGRSHP
jgi:hypothetical protein